MIVAADLALAHGLRLWDAVVCAAAERGGAKALLSEDLQDGRLLAGMRLLNPFSADDAPARAAAAEVAFGVTRLPSPSGHLSSGARALEADHHRVARRPQSPLACAGALAAGATSIGRSRAGDP